MRRAVRFASYMKAVVLFAGFCLNACTKRAQITVAPAFTIAHGDLCKAGSQWTPSEQRRSAIIPAQRGVLP
jgi:hypothetical protein